MLAREYIDKVRSCASRLDALHRELRALEDARDQYQPWQAKGSALTGGVGGTCSDPTMTEALSRIDGLYEQIKTIRAKVDEAECIVGECLRMLDEMRRDLGDRHADVIELYCIDCAGTWTEVALEMGVSRAHMYRLRDAALVWVGAHMVQYAI